MLSFMPPVRAKQARHTGGGVVVFNLVRIQNVPLLLRSTKCVSTSRRQDSASARFRNHGKAKSKVFQIWKRSNERNRSMKFLSFCCCGTRVGVSFVSPLSRLHIITTTTAAAVARFDEASSSQCHTEQASPLSSRYTRSRSWQQPSRELVRCVWHRPRRHCTNCNAKGHAITQSRVASGFIEYGGSRPCQPAKPESEPSAPIRHSTALAFTPTTSSLGGTSKITLQKCTQYQGRGGRYTFAVHAWSCCSVVLKNRVHPSHRFKKPNSAAATPLRGAQGLW